MKTSLAGRRSISIAVCAAALAIAPPVAAQFALPTQFVDEQVIGGLDVPVGMACLPDGRILVVEQVNARVRLIVNGALAATDPVLTVADVNINGSERGLLGIAVDPGWPARPYIYLQYDYLPTIKIRISRYTVGGDLSFTGNGSLTIDPSTRYDILTDLPDNAFNHNGGTLRFGPDGMLYSSLGDDATGCPAQNLTVLVGKILRLKVSGLPAGGGGPPALGLITPPDNPFVTDPNLNARLVWFSGLRNPFRFGIDPLTGNLAIGDVGEATLEEIDYVASPGASFEWPVREGNIPGPTMCPGADASRYTAPVYVYPHTEGAAVIGGVIYRRPAQGANRFPPEYDGDIFFSDFYSPWVRRLKGSGSTWSLAPAPGQPNGTDWGSGPESISDWLVAPDGALVYCRMFDGGGIGVIRRIRYTGTTSVPEPAATALELRAPYPAPARTTVSVDYVLASDALVTIAIYDLTGREVRALTRSEPQARGPHHVVWDTRDGEGRSVESGVYFAQISLGGERRQRRLVVVR
jgi:glucose/arabinose dehydrogenase